MKDKIQGKAEELKGKLTGNKADELKGKARQAGGEAKQAGKEIAYDVEHADRREGQADRPPTREDDDERI